MKYFSTRGDRSGLTAAEAIKRGIAPDGGLYMPESLPEISREFLQSLCPMSYAERAASVLAMFLDDYGYDTLLELCKKAYAKTSFGDHAAPVVELDGIRNVLELWHGPTSAFKDMALQIMPLLLSKALELTHETNTVCILVATSGDTGKAALEGYKNVDHTKIIVFYPENGVSNVQKRQMQTQEGDNVAVTAIRGNFDDAQNGVKRIFADSAFREKLAKENVILSSANSINWGRLVPQIVYYISAYCDLVNAGRLTFGDTLNICVPTGNFGNIFAAYLAKRMGLPLGKLVCASNQNNILTDFFNTGVYDRNRAFHLSMSPSMDILISSNLERLLYVVAGSEKTAIWMKQLNETGRYEVDAETLNILQTEFCGYYCNETDTQKTIRHYFDTYHYLADTHTAVGLYCADRYLADTGDTTAMLTASTASPYKFASNVLRSVSETCPEDEFDALDALSQTTKTDIPAPLACLRTKEPRFTGVIDKEEMEDRVYGFIRQ